MKDPGRNLTWGERRQVKRLPTDSMKRKRKVSLRPAITTVSSYGILGVLSCMALSLLASSADLSAQGICDRTPQVQNKLLEAAGVADCARVTPTHLAQVERLDLSGMLIRALQVNDFSGLDSLRVLWLHDNLMGFWNFPAGIYDDVLDTLEDLRVDPEVKAPLWFWSRAQETAAGYTVRVGAIFGESTGSAHAFPLVVRVPYSLEGTADPDDFADLPSASQRELVFMPGYDIQVIEFTVPRQGNNLGKTVVFRLGDVSQIRLRPSDGAGPDAPHLKAESLMNVRADKAVHTVTIIEPVPADVCTRTPAVQDEIRFNVHIQTNSWIYDCAELTTAHLTSVTSIVLDRANLTALQENDFSGLISLGQLSMRDNSLTELPKGIFSDLSNLNELDLRFNSLSTLPKGVFQGSGDLIFLDLSDNSLTELPEGVFQGLDNLKWLSLGDNSLTELPEGVFQGLDNLKSLGLSDNSLTTLPEAVFSDLNSLEWLSFARNSLTGLPEGIFRNLNSLEILFLIRNSLSQLPPAVFHGLTSIEGLYLSRNSLSELPEEIFQGLDSLKSLSFWANQLGSLPPRIFFGLDSLARLIIHTNFLDELPQGIFDDVLDTLGGEYELRSVPFTGRLYVSDHLQARLAFTSPGQRAAEGTTVRVEATLSREAPVTVRVPYTVGFSGAAGGLRDLSPPPEAGLLFPAGETRQEIVFTLEEEAGIQGTRTIVLTLGKPSEISLSRSDGRGPDAPHLDSESLILRPREGAVHTVTVSDVDPEEREPFCLSLWRGASCSTAAIFSHAVVGPLSGSVARTELVLTHRDPEAAGCEAAVLFGRGTSPAPPVAFNGHVPDNNLFYATLPRGGATVLTLTAPGAEQAATGAVHVFTRSPCSAGSLNVQGHLLLESQADGEIEELVSLPASSSEDWLGDGDCRVLAGVFGNGRDLVLASVTARPNRPAPPGTRLEAQAFDLNGNFIGTPPGLEISGAQQVLPAGEFDRPTIIEACLNVPGTGSPFRMALSAIVSKAAGSRVQYGVESLPGGTGP